MYHCETGLMRRESHGRRRMKGASEYFIFEEEQLTRPGLGWSLGRRRFVGNGANCGWAEASNCKTSGRARDVTWSLMTIALSFAGSLSDRAEGAIECLVEWGRSLRC